MKLMWAELHGYKRFFDKTKINLQGKLIALVGPNEVGKSSLLQAIQHLSSEKKFIEEPIHQELTRGKKIPPDQGVIKFAFLVEREDTAAIKHINQGKNVKWLIWTLDAENYSHFDLIPRPTRDIKLRIRIKKILERMMKSKVILEIIDNIPSNLPETEINEEVEFLKRLEKLIIDLDSETETLNAEIVNNIKNIVVKLSKLINDTYPKYIREFPENLEDFLKTETAKIPKQRINDILSNKIPEILFFSEENRDLKHIYDIGNQEGFEYPQTLENLANLAGLNMDQLRNAVLRNDQALIHQLCDNANEKLKKEFEIWTQSAVTVIFRVNNRSLLIHVEDDKKINSIAEESDGWKYFVTLLAFIKNNQSIKPILLIDEIEQHLHYDAQVDMTQMLAKQELASKVIYSTHSIGCLPEDLGLGVRSIRVKPNDEGRKIFSEINNWFWMDRRPGLMPLLTAMGASMLAFLPLRYAVFTEGITEVILLPSLLREAIGEEFLGFQIIPGLSEASIDQVAILNNEAARNVYLVDGDDGGEKIIEKLKEAKIPDEKIFGYSDEKNYVTEDFVDSVLYCEAVNNLLTRYEYDLEIKTTELPEENRAKYVADLCKEMDFKISKREITYEILDIHENRKFVEKGKEKILKDLYSGIYEQLFSEEKEKNV